MYSKVISCSLQGMDGKLVEVEVDLSNGLPQFNIVGLPDSAVRESMERVRAAIKNCGFEFPMKRITVNLAPAHVRKEGAAFDLAIAVGILIASEQLTLEDRIKTLIVGELSLDGAIRPIPGVLSMIADAKKQNINKMLVPLGNAREAALVQGTEVYALNHLLDMKQDMSANLINGVNDLLGEQSFPTEDTDAAHPEDYAEVRGQQQAKRALMIAAAGMHNILLIGPPGSGKTMLMRRLPSILPALSDEEALEVTKVYSVSNLLSQRTQLIRHRPFRSPHHTISQVGLIGGGSIPKPGEVSLAHHGILFLDELPEFPRNVLEVLRQPLEDKQVTISRAKSVCTFPTEFLLAASMNPCPCGYMGNETEANPCMCTANKIGQYRSKISGPLLDRIDMQVEVPRVEYADFTTITNNLSSADMKIIIDQAIQLQQERYQDDGIRFNSQLSGNLLHKHCTLTKETEELLKLSFDTIGLSVRAHDRILKIARTIADLEGCCTINVGHIAEAIQYRSLDRKYLQ